MRWLSLIGITENGLDGLSPEAKTALQEAELVFGGKRHLQLAKIDQPRGREWPVPFSIAKLISCRGRKVVVLASNDPFHFGVGRQITTALPRDEWICFTAPSCFAMAAAHLGWPLEDTTCLGLHAKDFGPAISAYLAGNPIIATMRDADAAQDLASRLAALGEGEIHALQKLGGPDQLCQSYPFESPLSAPCVVAAKPQTAKRTTGVFGLPDDCFVHNGQITKAPIRAFTLNALNPQQGQVLWDLGAGSGSISVEWCLKGGIAHAVEAKADRLELIAANRQRFGLDQTLHKHAGKSDDLIAQLPLPHSVFVGGGFSLGLLERLIAQVPRHTIIVANAVTIETEHLLLEAHSRYGGQCLRLDVASLTQLGGYRAFTPLRPVVQWSWRT